MSSQLPPVHVVRKEGGTKMLLRRREREVAWDFLGVFTSDFAFLDSTSKIASRQRYGGCRITRTNTSSIISGEDEVQIAYRIRHSPFRTSACLQVHFKRRIRTCNSLSLGIGPTFRRHLAPMSIVPGPKACRSKSRPLDMTSRRQHRLPLLYVVIGSPFSSRKPFETLLLVRKAS
jgi:hypothetical protein